MRVLLKVIVGNRSTSRKSGDFRCASRRSSCVLSVRASIAACTDEAVKSSSLKLISALTPVKAPLTVMMPMCLAENSTWVCIGSTDQLIAALHSMSLQIQQYLWQQYVRVLSILQLPCYDSSVRILCVA